MTAYDTHFDSTSGQYKATRFEFWLTFHKNGPMRLTSKKPAVGRDERAMFLDVVLPNSLWENPELSATVEVADPGTSALAIDVKAASAALSQALGIDIDLQVKAPGDDG